ncbi:MAG: FAD-dependent oxidoreductase [Planctomycetaceae bacterium]|nr:FAD-dependent oxidoreductase [Planctomycetaceae bacterium]
MVNDIIRWAAGLAVFVFASAASATEMKADVCVYGGTSGGVVAAVQAARMGKRVVLVEPGRHLGGMTSGGLSAVDIGDPRSIGGIAREYFTRLVATYGKALNWDHAFEGRGGPATGGAYSIEPHVAERVFDNMVLEAGVLVLRETMLEAVEKEGARIIQIRLNNDRAVQAKMFIDATYEGDLLAAAGVSYTLVREANAKYDEQYNGIHYTDKYKPRTGHKQPGENGRVPGGQGVWDRDFPLDPFIIKGDPSSGLLPLVAAGDAGQQGEAAPGVMAYCFRLCLTTDKANMLPITPPSAYDPARYELVARFIEACLANGDQMDLRWFSKHDPLPNEKWDFNTATFGGNLPGASWDWPEANYTRRVQIAKEIEDYHRGLLHFLATDARVPTGVRNDIQRFGLPQDEFIDNGGWPHQLYIREGRRMVSDLVMTEHHTFGRTIASHSIGLGSYGTDVHEVRRIAKDGVVIREGKVASGRGGFGPYQIGYGAIVPKQVECNNLFVTFALSASHTAFASIRMEPVLMVTSQSAATAACLAIDANVPVQHVSYEILKSRLLADGQVLSWASTGVDAIARKTRRTGDLPGIVLDDDSAEFIGTWTKSSGQPSLLGTAYHHDGGAGRGEKSAKFRPNILVAGDYEVRLLYPWHENRSTKTKVVIQCATGSETMVINQQQPVLINRVPQSLGTFRFAEGRSGYVMVTNEAADGYVVVDGVQLVPIEIARQERIGQRDSGYAN